MKEDAAAVAILPVGAQDSSDTALSQELGETLLFTKPNIYCHFAQGIGEPKYLPVSGWPSLNKLLAEALDTYNEVNAVMNLVSTCPPVQLGVRQARGPACPAGGRQAGVR